MPNTPRTLAVAATLLATVWLAGCGGAPSESDMKAALERQTQAQVDGASRLFGHTGAGVMKDVLPEILSLKKIGCQADGEKAYRCDVELEVRQFGMTNKSPTNLRFVQGSEGWTVVGP